MRSPGRALRDPTLGLTRAPASCVAAVQVSSSMARLIALVAALVCSAAAFHVGVPAARPTCSSTLSSHGAHACDALIAAE